MRDRFLVPSLVWDLSKLVKVNSKMYLKNVFHSFVLTNELLLSYLMINSSAGYFLCLDWCVRSQIAFSGFDS